MKLSVIAAAIAFTATAAHATFIPAELVGTKDGRSVQQSIDSLKDRDAQLAADIHQVHMNTLGKYSESWGLEDRANIAALQKDQKRQDDQAATYASSQKDRDAGQDEHINAVQGSAQTANEKADSLAVRSDSIEKQAGLLDGRVGDVEVRTDNLEDGQRQQNAQMEYDRQQRESGDAQNAEDISKESQIRAQQNVELVAGVQQAQATGDYAKSMAERAYGNAETNAQAIRSTNAKVAQNSAQLANHEQRIGNLEQITNSRFANIDKRIDDNKRQADAGIASVAAMSNIPQVTGGARFSAGVGVGQRGSEQAIAVGFSSQLTTGVVGKISVASDSQQKWTTGAGLSVQW